MELIGDHEFKYHVDFDALSVNEDIAAVCVSRPTNPTGNVLTDDEETLALQRHRLGRGWALARNDLLLALRAEARRGVPLEVLDERLRHTGPKRGST